MTFEDAMMRIYKHAKLLKTAGNEKFPFYIDRLLIMPVKRDDENELCIIKWVIGQDVDFKKAFAACDLREEDFDVYIYTKTQTITGFPIRPILLSEYIS